MPSNQTPNYQLSQWERTDKVLMEDFNADNAKIDAALAALKAQADSQQSAVAQHGSSIARLGSCQVYATTYTGDGSISKSLSFPAYPVFVYVQLVNGMDRAFFVRGTVCAAGDYGNIKALPNWSSRGLSWQTDTNSSVLNRNGNVYAAVALLDKSR